MESSFIDKFARLATLVLLVGIFIVGVIIIYPICRRNMSLREEAAGLDREIDRKRAEIAKIAENQRRFMSDPEFLEKIARQNRRVYPGEYIFLFEE